MLEAGDLLLLYTDGLTEAADAAGEEFGEARIEALAREHAGATAAELIQILFERIDRFTGAAAQHDDMTIVAARVL